MNLIDGTVAEAGPSGVTLRTGESDAAIALPPHERARAGMAGCAAVRPEKMTMRREDEVPADVPNRLAGEVFDIAYMGDYTLYRVRTASGALIEASRFNRRRVEEDPITWHDRVALTFEPADAIFLDR